MKKFLLILAIAAATFVIACNSQEDPPDRTGTNTDQPAPAKADTVTVKPQ